MMMNDESCCLDANQEGKQSTVEGGRDGGEIHGSFVGHFKALHSAASEYIYF